MAACTQTGKEIILYLTPFFISLSSLDQMMFTSDWRGKSFFLQSPNSNAPLFWKSDRSSQKSRFPTDPGHLLGPTGGQKINH